MPLYASLAVGDFLVKLKRNRTRSTEEVINGLREEIGAAEPALNTEFPGVLSDLIGDLTWSPDPIEIKIFTNDLTGPVATGVSVAAFFAAGATLIWGEDLGGVARKALYVVLAVSFMIGGYNFLSALGLTGSII